MNPFATLGIAPTYDLDVGAVEKTHRELSRAMHPDRYAASGASERREALARAVEINEAWRIVRDPLRRAEALLSLRGIAVGESDGPALDPEFLMQMLEQREALSVARGVGNRSVIRGLGETIGVAFRETERELCHGLIMGARELLVAAVGKLRFYRRFLDEVSAIEDELV
jgi:molecular chaperone HscB